MILSIILEDFPHKKNCLERQKVNHLCTIHRKRVKNGKKSTLRIYYSSIKLPKCSSVYLAVSGIWINDTNALYRKKCTAIYIYYCEKMEDA